MPENRNNNKDGVTTAYPSWIHAQDQTGSTGLDSKMDPPAAWTQIEHWDNDGKPYLKEYEGRGQLDGKAALITGGDSGIGRSVAILMAREGADITICYLPHEKEDADICVVASPSSTLFEYIPTSTFATSLETFPYLAVSKPTTTQMRCKTHR